MQHSKAQWGSGTPQTHLLVGVPSAQLSRRSLLLGLAAIPMVTACHRVGSSLPIDPGRVPDEAALRQARAVAAVSSCDWSWEQKSYDTLVNWFLGTLLGTRRIRVSSVYMPEAKPSSCDDVFHDLCSTRYIIQETRISSARSTRYGFHVGVDAYLRADEQVHIPDHKDLNTVELRCIWSVNKKKKSVMFFPCGFRQPAREEHWPAFAECCMRNKRDPEEYILHYWRPFNDGHSSRPGFGIQSKLNGATDLLM